MLFKVDVQKKNWSTKGTLSVMSLTFVPMSFLFA